MIIDIILATTKGGFYLEINSVFVYGTLMSGMGNHGLIKPLIKDICVGEAKGILYDLPYGYPAMINGKGKVQGELFRLRHMEQALEILDRLEGYYGPDHDDNLYHRVTREIKITGGEKLLSYVYLWANPGELPQLGTLIKGGSWKKIKGGGYI